MELTLSMLKPEFLEFIRDRQELVTSTCTKLLPTASNNNRLSAAMRYSVLNSGKCLRPLLVYAIGEALQTPIAKLHAAAASVELIHCYSLIHDDLPAMDDDDLRRGLPSCHIAFDEATAILAGDALQALAFEVLSDSELNPVGEMQQLAMVKALARASGASGMVLGQALDLAAEQKTIGLSELIMLHQNKTGALFSACVELGFLASSVCSDQKLHQQLQEFAKNLGLAFQIQDDILDVTSDSATLGKPAGSDQKLHKATFPSLLGLEVAQSQAEHYFEQATAAIAGLDAQAEILINLTMHLKNRWR
jgi:farnesyl diphosphate synthase